MSAEVLALDSALKMQGDTEPMVVSVLQATGGAAFPLTGATLGNGANGNGSFLAVLRDPQAQLDYALLGTWSNLVSASGQVSFNWAASDSIQVVPGTYLFIVKITISGVVYIPKPAQIVIQAS